MKRRDFLQMLGVGGAGLALATSAAASPIVPMFSGKGSKLWTPEHTSLTRSHLVLVRPGAVPWQTAKTPAGADPAVPRMRRDMWPTTGGTKSAQRGGPLYRRDVVLRHLDAWGDNPPTAVVEFDEGDDPHHAFYRAAMKMREDFAKESQRRLLKVPEWRRPHSTLVTLVDTPIFAGAMPAGPGKEQLLCEISYTPYVFDASDELNLNGWEVYSENGEYPVEVPSAIDMGHLLAVETRIFTGKLNPLELRGKIIVP